ncbi:radical SAM domain protein [Bacteriovorax sp. Seq25_V]|nr:radical SAM domain protein [Bacteriovorax sp. Seq25_V]
MELLSEFNKEYHDQWIDMLSEEELIAKVVKSGCRIAIIRATSFCFEESLSLSKKLQKNNIITIAIGQQTTQLLKISESLATDSYRYILHGETEIAVRDLIVELTKCDDDNELKSKYFEKFKSNYYHIVEKPEELPLLTFTQQEHRSYPFPFPVRGGFFKKWAYLLSAWGCPHKCDFCTLLVRKSTGDNLRRRSPERVVEDIENLVRQGADFIVIEDDTFFCNRNHLRTICRLIIDKKIKISWMCNARIDEIDEESLALAKEAGLKLVKVGIETGSPRVIEKLGKCKSGTTWLENISTSFKLFEQYEVGAIGLFMVATPGEEIEDFRQTVELLRTINPDYIQVQIFTPYPDIKYYKEVENFVNSEKSFYHYKVPEVKLSKITEYTESEMQNLLYRRFYLNPRYIYRHLRYCWRYYTNASYVRMLTRKLFEKFSDILRIKNYEA